MRLHTILGAGGAIANELLPILMDAKEPIRIVARHPKQIIGVESVAADLSDADVEQVTALLKRMSKGDKS